MELIIKNRNRNELLGRDEVTCIIKSATNPRFEETKKLISENLHANTELIIVKKIEGRYGAREFDIEVYIYDSKEALEKIEPKAKAKKEAKQEAEKEKAPQAEKKAEQKIEKKEEKTEPIAK